MAEFTRVRINILVIALFIALVCAGILIVIALAILKGGNNQFVIGALIGLLGSGITGLAGLGTTLLTEGN